MSGPVNFRIRYYFESLKSYFMNIYISIYLSICIHIALTHTHAIYLIYKWNLRNGDFRFRPFNINTYVSYTHTSKPNERQTGKKLLRCFLWCFNSSEILCTYNGQSRWKYLSWLFFPHIYFHWQSCCFFVYLLEHIHRQDSNRRETRRMDMSEMHLFRNSYSCVHGFWRWYGMAFVRVIENQI